MCQVCGSEAAEAHHYHLLYRTPNADDLTAVCAKCHHVTTLMRRFLVRGGAWWEFKRALERALEESR